MNNSVLKLTAIVFFALSINLSAQSFKGKAYYQTKRNIDLNLEGSEMSEEQKSMIQERLKKQFERTFILTFDKEASSYALEESLDNPTANSGGIRMVMVGGPDSSGKLYKNTKTQNYSDQQDLFGKMFLIKDKLNSLDWKLVDETKIIGKYLCFKATALREIENTSNQLAADENQTSQEHQTVEKRLISAWYTTDIPVSHGPHEFWGLPGLILELNDGEDMQYICNKIVMNVKEEINEPTKGKVVSREEFIKIRDAKMEEMNKNRGREGRGDNGKIRIRIGG